MFMVQRAYDYILFDYIEFNKELSTYNLPYILPFLLIYNLYFLVKKTKYWYKHFGINTQSMVVWQYTPVVLQSEIPRSMTSGEVRNNQTYPISSVHHRHFLP